MKENIETLILSNIISNETYTRKVLPFLQEDYFTTRPYRLVYNLISDHFTKYNQPPELVALNIELDELDCNESDYKETKEILSSLEDTTSKSVEWLIEKTEKFCQDRAIYNAIMESISIIDEDDVQRSKGAIPEILRDALSVNFDSHIGHNFFENAEDRYDSYHEIVRRLPFRIDLLNKITNGGVPTKTLNVFMGVTGVGKTLVLCDLAASNLQLGKNVLYITLEMAEERIAERIDANLMNCTLHELKELPKDSYLTKVQKLQKKTQGTFVVKEYPTASVGASHFRHLLSELKMKKNFTPDVIYIDYLNLCTSSRMKIGGSVNTYTYIKSIAEELRGLAVEHDVPIFSATQANRDGYNTSDIDTTNVSESIGLAATVDFLLGIVVTEELEDEKKMMIKQLKNRYGDPSYYRKFLVGMDRSRMKLYDIEQGDLLPDASLPTPSAPTKQSKFDVSKFEEWK